MTKITQAFTRNFIYILAITFAISTVGCKDQNTQKANTPDNHITEKTTEASDSNPEEIIALSEETTTHFGDSEVESDTEIEAADEPTTTIDTTALITPENLALEAEYQDMLMPIASLKTEKPETYWFIVSWLKTNYKTPDWTNYDSSDSWRMQAKVRGIDCSGFTRIMQDQIFNTEVSGGSQRLLDFHSNRISTNQLTMGDLVFFKAPYSKTDRIVHVGVYLQDNYFVHATSTRSAAEGLGLKVDTLEDERWDDELVTAGRIKK